MKNKFGNRKNRVGNRFGNGKIGSQNRVAQKIGSDRVDRVAATGNRFAAFTK